MALKVAINGFGRIGRLIFRHAFDNPAIEIVAINDITDAATLGHLLLYDSVYGKFRHDVKATENTLEVAGRSIKVLREPEPTHHSWKELGVELVFEASGRFTKSGQAKTHLDAGAKWVLITAPAKGVDITVVYGVNHTALDFEKHRVISNASCTTNCLAPIVKVVHEEFGIVHGLLTTVHSTTNDQRILDLTHTDLRRARAAGLSIIPTTTGAARAVTEVFPELKGKLDGLAVRVPTTCVSMVDFTFTAKKDLTVQAINEALARYAKGPLEGIMEVCTAPLVSIDFRGSEVSSTIDALSTMVIGDRMGKILAWYDNEFGYAARCVDVAVLFPRS
jgi:glyceraldehyde 3-phosphate dehydrogenase